MTTIYFPSDGPVELREGIDGVGGGRGVFARQKIHAGQLILVESPLVRVPHDKGPEETLHASLARALIESERREELVAHFHPKILTDIPSEGLMRARVHYKSDIERLVSLMGSVEAREASPDEVLLLLLKVQCNSFYSGVYLLSAMFNHRCNPNTIKLAREGGSEIRALRSIEEGEELSFSYVAPPLQSFMRRSELLLAQHYFSIDPITCGFPSVMEEDLVKEGREEERERNRQFLIAFEDRLDEIDSKLGSSPELDALSSLTKDLTTLSAEAKAYLHTRHIAIARMNSLILTASRNMLPLCPTELNDTESGRPLSTVSALRLISAALDLKETQELFSGSPDHYDLALTLEDLFVTIEHLLSNDPKALFAEFKQFSSFSKASLAASQFKKKHLHIRSIFNSH